MMESIQCMELKYCDTQSRSTEPSTSHERFLVFRWSVCVSDVLSHKRDFEDPDDAVLSRGKSESSVSHV